MVKPGFLLMKTSAQRWPRMTKVSEPFTVMLRPSAIRATAPVTSNAAVPRAKFEIFLIISSFVFVLQYEPQLFQQCYSRRRLELVNDVKLQALQHRLRRSRGMPVERAPDQTGEAQLDVLVGLVEHFYTMLGDIAVLAQVAEVEGAHDGFAFDEHARVGELEVLGFREAADAAFEPIATALAREAGGVARHGCDRCCRGRGSGCRQIANVGAGLRVLDVVTENNEREAWVRSLN